MNYFAGGKPSDESEETPAWYSGRCGRLVGTFIILSMFGFGVWFATHISDVQSMNHFNLIQINWPLLTFSDIVLIDYFESQN